MATPNQFYFEDVEIGKVLETPAMTVTDAHVALYGGLVGAAAFMLAHHWLSDLNPIYWQFWLGLLLVVVGWPVYLFTLRSSSRTQ